MPSYSCQIFVGKWKNGHERTSYGIICLQFWLLLHNAYYDGSSIKFEKCRIFPKMQNLHQHVLISCIRNPIIDYFLDWDLGMVGNGIRIRMARSSWVIHNYSSPFRSDDVSIAILRPFINSFRSCWKSDRWSESQGR